MNASPKCFAVQIYSFCSTIYANVDIPPCFTSGQHNRGLT